MLKTTLALLAGLGLSLAVGTANAQTLCGERGDIVESLLRQYKEQPTAIGLASNGGLVEVLTSESGTWTLMMTMPTGQTCIMAAGEHWESLPKIAMGPDA